MLGCSHIHSPAIQTLSMSKTIALVDCNNMFASCEKVFRPDLDNIPVISLSSNDGCVIARSYEAKALGIKMAQPYHEVKHFEHTHGLTVFSANFALYSDMSQRILSIIESFSPDVVPYSIDESFASLIGIPGPLAEYGSIIQQAILKQTGIGTGVGIATSKTLAKIANNAAKKYKQTGGVVDIVTDPSRRERLLSVMPASDVWGVGNATTKRLAEIGIHTALELAQLGETKAKTAFNIVLARTVAELNGESVLPWEIDTAINQQIIASRSLGRKITDPDTLFASVAYHVGRGARKLISQSAAASSITVSIRTNAFSTSDKQYSNAFTMRLEQASNNVIILTKAARAAFKQIYREGYQYSKTGITMNGIVPTDKIQNDLFSLPDEMCKKSAQLIDTMGDINSRFGLGATVLASQKQGGDWRPRSATRSPLYTTSWPDIPKII